MATNTKLTRILSIDGGGIRGIIPGQILVSLEEKLKKMDKNPKARIADYFDLIAGTSTGGILTCIYLCPDAANPKAARFSAAEAVDLYLERGDEIFDITFWQKVKSTGGITDEKYSAVELEEALNDFMGNLKLSQLIKPTLITSYDIRRRKGHFFRSHIAKMDTSYDFLVKEVARSTSAAPTYFEVARTKSMTNVVYALIDGGVFVNNPTMCAYSEARKLTFDADRIKPTAAEMVMLSLGTGNVDKPYYYQEAKDWGLVQWVQPILDIMMSGVADTVDYQLKQIYDAVERPNQYLRISPALGNASSAMDDASQKNLKALKETGLENAIKFDKELTAFAKLLIENK